MEIKTIQTNMQDVQDTENKSVTALIQTPVNGSVEIGFEGYSSYNAWGEHSGEAIVLVENRNGVPTVVVWADKASEEPTHVIPLDKAQASTE